MRNIFLPFRYFTVKTWSIATQLEFDPKQANEEAGMILLNNGAHFDLMIKESNGRRIFVNRLRFGSVIHESKEVVLIPGAVKLAIKGERTTFSFLYSRGDDPFTEIAKVDSKYSSSETVGGFTGVFVGLYATVNGKASTASADYDWFQYLKNEAPRQGGRGFRGF